MKKLCVLAAMILLAHFAGGCWMLSPPPKVYDDPGAYGEAHPDQVRPMPYMDPDNGYSNDNK